jgi:hypothetical protein
MTRPPFGFGPSDRPDDEPGGDDPFGLSAMFGGAGGPFGGDMGSVFAQMQKLMSWTGGPVNWDLADEVATGATRPGDVPVTPEQARQVTEACRLADVWLDAATTFPASGAEPQAWTRTGWVGLHDPAWRASSTPSRGRVVGAMGTALEQGLGRGAGGVPRACPRGRGAARRARPAGGGSARCAASMDQVGGFVFGAQVGQALGCASPGGAVRHRDRPAAVDARQAGAAARERRAFSAGSRSPPTTCGSTSPCASWPPAAVRLGAVAAVAPCSTPSTRTPAGSRSTPRHRAGRRLDRPLRPRVDAAGDGRGPVRDRADAGAAGGAGTARDGAGARRGLGRRRRRRRLLQNPAVRRGAARDGAPPRASGGPGEQTFATSSGCSCGRAGCGRRRRCGQPVAERGGATARDALWAHPDLLPSATDLDDPAGFVARTATGTEAETDWDAGLRGLDKDLDGTLDDDASDGPKDS